MGLVNSGNAQQSKATQQLDSCNPTGCDIETMALMVACLNQQHPHKLRPRPEITCQDALCQHMCEITSF